VGVSFITGVFVEVGVTVSVGAGVSVGIAKAVWVISAAKVPTACVWIDSTLSVGVISFSLDPHALRKILLIRDNPTRAY
jgi:hypothetical protein